MKTIHEILVLVNNVFHQGSQMGLCSAAMSVKYANDITMDEFFVFKKYLKHSLIGHKQFYDWQERKTMDSTKFAWKPNTTKPRIAWLDKHLELTK